MNASRRRLGTVLGLVAVSLFCVALVLVRFTRSGSTEYTGLIWNLFLAWIPFVLAVGVYDRWRRHGAGVAVLALGALWLLFFPNAPYIVTDFVHLQHRDDAPYWYDAVTVSAFAWTGLLLGFGSLFLMQTVVRQWRGVVSGWIFAGVALALGSLGIYLGRFLRLNSWDVVTRPHELVYLARIRLADPLGNPKLILVVGLMSAFLAVAYAVFSALWDAGESRVPEQRTPR